MTAPALAASRFGIAFCVGALLGLVYGFFRPLRPRLTHLCDGIFVILTFWAWIYVGFGICLGDLRFGYTAGMLLGIVVWEASIGWLLRPIWRKIWYFLGFLLLPAKKIFAFFRIFLKKLLAKCKKWVTMGWNIGRNMQYNAKNGGTDHGKEEIPRSIQEKQSAGKDLSCDRHSPVHRRIGHALRQHRAKPQPIRGHAPTRRHAGGE